jgi:pimeloyl-ACP methyl ester carboxylesterase
LVVIEGTGHIPMVGKPDEFNQLVKNFVSSTPQPAAR